MTRILNKDFKIDSTNYNIQNEVKTKTYYGSLFDDILIDTYIEYLNLKPNMNYDKDTILKKFKAIIEIEYINYYRYRNGSDKLLDCYYFSEVLEQQISKYLNSDIFKLESIFYHPLNSIFISNAVGIQNCISYSNYYYDLNGEEYEFGLKYFNESDNVKYCIHGCIFINITLSGKLIHMLLILCQDTSHSYTIPQYVLVNDDIYNNHIKMIEKNTEYNNIEHLHLIRT